MSNEQNKKETTLAICIATWNSEKYLPELFKSIFVQTIFTKKNYPIKVSINVVDSGSTDGSIKFIQEKYSEVHILKNTHNLGFATSYNQAIRMSRADYILILNADVILEEEYIELLLAQIKKDSEIGSISGKLLRAKFIASTDNGNSLDIQKTSIIDSLGLAVKRNRRVVNIAEGEPDSEKYNKRQEIFGLSATATLYSAKALEDIRYNDEYFDQDFFAYKEDFDLAWRLQISGYKSIFFPNAIAYHFRSAKEKNKKYTNLSVVRSYKDKNKFIRKNSYRNHLLTLIKNETKRNFLRDFFPIIWYEGRKLVYLLFFDWSTLIGFGEFIRLIPHMFAKRKFTMKHRRVKAEKVRYWFIK